MDGFSHQAEFFMVDVLVYMVIHWTKPKASHNVKLSNNHDFTKLFHCIVSQHWENIEFVPKLLITLTYE